MARAEFPQTGAGNRSSVFFPGGHDKRNLWWKAFRKTVLQPHSIKILESTAIGHVPGELLQLVEEICQNLDRFEGQANDFRQAVANGRGFGPSPIFPPDIVPPIQSVNFISRSMEPEFDIQTLPQPKIGLNTSLFDLPCPRPGLACGFSSKAFESTELECLPDFLTVSGMVSDYGTGQIHPGHIVHCSFLLFERTYGHGKHEIEAAMNYCAMSGASALNAFKLLYEKAWDKNASQPPSPVVFSCTVDDDVGIIHHHWIDEDGSFCAAPLCKFDFRDPEHFMHFLAWVEAIEKWATYYLLPDILDALSTIANLSTQNEASGSRPVSVPITCEEKEEKLNKSMQLAFENIPWQQDRARGTPLSVTSAMRMRSPKSPDSQMLPSDTPVTATKMSQAQTMTDPVKYRTLSASTSPDRGASKSRSSTVPVSGLEASDTYDATPAPGQGNTFPVRSSSRSPPRSILDTDVIKTTSKTSTTSSPAATSANSNRQYPSPADVALPESAKSFGSYYKPMATASSQNSYWPPFSATTNNTVTPGLPSSTSIRSKRSFVSIRRDKRMKSPNTADFNNSDQSPRAAGFVAKISTGLGMMKTRPRKVRTDNAGPPTPKLGDMPLPTPAYDKHRFAAPNRSTSPVPTNGWVDQILKDRVIVSDVDTPQDGAQTPLNNATSNYLPLRQYTEDSHRTMATTVTTGPVRA